MPSLLEVAANLTITVSILLAGRNSVHTWWTGIVGCILFALLFFDSKLYADVTLQLFFIVTSLVGWWQWMYGRQGDALPVSHVRLRAFAWLIPAGICATAAYGILLHVFTDAYAPFADSAVLAFSVIGQFLLMRRRVQAWPLWLVVNSIAVPLYASRSLYLTAALYSVYWVNAIVSWWYWHKQATQGTALAAPAT